MFKDANTRVLVSKIMPFVDKDEEIITSGTFEAKASFVVSALTLGLANRYHYIGVTNKRVLILPLSKITTKPIKDKVYSVAYDDVKIEKNALIINRQKDNKPIKFAFKFGMSSFSGMSKEDSSRRWKREKRNSSSPLLLSSLFDFGK